MLTVLYRDEDGAESIFEAETVQRIPPYVGKPSPFDYGVGILVTLEDGRKCHYSDTRSMEEGDKPRRVFVMNKHGKTVARYDL